MRKRKIIILAAAAALLFGALLAAAWITALPERMAFPGSRMVLYADGTPMCVFLSPDDKWRIPVRLEEIDPDYLDALIRFEDSRFYLHPGVDPVAIARAVLQNLKSRRVVSGASTITMQLVRILEPRPRSLKSKVIEAFRAVQIETRLSKKEILEKYLEFAPYGKNLEGIEAASLACFGHGSHDLSPFEISYLLSVPQNPAARYPSPRHAKHMPKVIAHVARVLRDAGAFSAEEEASALRGVPPERLKPFPRNAMHAAYYLMSAHPEARVRSTIRREAQSVVESAMAGYKTEYASMGIYNSSVVVLDIASGDVAAAAGNFDFWDADHHGQVAGFKALRSPGSAMKPFVYALAIDRGEALPGYMVEDIPVHFADYEPINYDREFHGLIRLEDALSLSLNIPFVNLLHDVGLDQYLAFLRSAGITSLEGEPGYYGLSIAIGALDVSLLELVNMYAMLGRGGEYKEAGWTAGGTDRGSRRLLSPGSCRLVRQALSKRDRPDFPERKRAAQLQSRIFWKTGTSAFHRDAWAVGANQSYAAGVWTGNFDGTSSRCLVGSERSGPILFDVLEGLSRNEKSRRLDPPPADLIPVTVCAWSGYLAGKSCPHLKTVLAPVKSLPRRTCPFHVQYLVDKETGLRTNPLCAAGLQTEARTFTLLPTSMRRWIADVKVDAASPPPFHPSCRQLAVGDGPRITSPRPDAVYFLVPGLKAEKQEIMAEAEAGADVGKLSWFVDGMLMAEAAPHERVWVTPAPGDHEIRVLDMSGKSDAIKIKIMLPG